jgi:flagellar hook-length control protein FliK
VQSPPAAPAAQPVAQPAAAQPQPPAHLADAPEVAAAVIRVAAQNRASEARIELTPPELGHIQIHLRYTEDGVSATLTADHADTVQALGQAATDLRRTLESQGITVQTLDISQSGAGSPDQGPRRDAQAQQSAPTGRLSGEPDDQESEVTIEASSLPLASGRVDILA